MTSDVTRLPRVDMHPVNSGAMSILTPVLHALIKVWVLDEIKGVALFLFSLFELHWTVFWRVNLKGHASIDASGAVTPPRHREPATTHRPRLAAVARKGHIGIVIITERPRLSSSEERVMIIVEDEVMVKTIRWRITPSIGEDREGVKISGDRSGALIDGHHLIIARVSNDGALTKGLVKFVSADVFNDLRGVVVSA